jgi:hypothetical protein
MAVAINAVSDRRRARFSAPRARSLCSRDFTATGLVILTVEINNTDELMRWYHITFDDKQHDEPPFDVQSVHFNRLTNSYCKAGLWSEDTAANIFLKLAAAGLAVSFA